jgi:hypothetical protein
MYTTDNVLNKKDISRYELDDYMLDGEKWNI